MQDVLKQTLKDLQLLTQSLQEENRKLKTAAPPILDTSLPSGMTSSTSFASQSSNSLDIGTTDISTNSSVPLTEKLRSLLDSKDSQKELQYGTMKMVMFGHIWWERKQLFGVQHDLAIRELNATMLTNAIDSGIKKPLPEQIAHLCLVLLLYEHIPAAYHPLVGGSITGEYHKLEKIMKKAATDNHSNLINQLKRVAATIFEDIMPAGHFCPGFDRSVDPLCQHLMGYKLEKNEYTRLPPCLFSDGFTMGATMFRTLIGVKILTCLLWGKTALDAPNMSMKRMNSNLWHMKEVNTSVLAFVGVTMHWMLSRDTKFASPGNKTGINYIPSHEATISPPNELPAIEHHPVMNKMSPGPTRADIDTSDAILDIGKASCSKKKRKKGVKTAPTTAPRRVMCSHGGQPCDIVESDSTVTNSNQASKRKGHAKEASVAAWPSRVNNASSQINVQVDTVTPIPTCVTTVTTLGVHFEDSVNDGENENEDDEDDEEEEEEEESE
ncbi:hypothetical protein EDD18DRAFT_1355763 [Armillaria luteobubalina]|uniref:Uncharacterized protein n=1 Tax=Armillaria luteobubalina TaxID=153913 RepID=A0AA39Q173_9AGAR|nr:hypothetical protein EDD18DRAFT_1355763 [Armillaria luteobubalina]